MALETEIRESVQSVPVPVGRLQKRVFSVSKRIGFFRRKTRKPVPMFQVLPGKSHHVTRMKEDLMLLLDSDKYHEHRDLLTQAIGATWRGPDLRNMDPEEYMFYQQHGLCNPYWIVGQVDVTHEPGLKTRYFAAPSTVLQRAVEPLKDALQSILPDLPWDCTLDQRKADCTIQTHLRLGKTVHSVDLSKATDNFPWDFQKAVLLAVLHKDCPRTRKSRRLFTDIVEKGQWRSPLRRRNMKWTKGQPLGLGPSFALFTISHGILLFVLNKYRWDGAFYVLGDDVVIFSEQLYKEYRKVLSLWELPVSESKSFVSSYIAQFAGVTYTRKESFWVPKWNEFTRSNLLDAQAWWFPGLTKGLKDDGLITHVLSLPEPFGKGWNPKGLPLDVRLPQEVVNEIEEENGKKALKPKESSTVLSKSKWFHALTKQEPNLYFWWSLLDERPERSVRPRQIPRHLMPIFRDGTEAKGYPRQRFNRRRSDPYSLGTIKRWKRLLMSHLPTIHSR